MKERKWKWKKKKLTMKKKVDANNYLVEKEITEEINYHQNPKNKNYKEKLSNQNRKRTK